MTKDEIINELTAIFRDIFDESELILNNNTSAKDIETWDSLTNITLFAEIESAFGIKLSMKEISRLKNVGDIVELISRKS